MTTKGILHLECDIIFFFKNIIVIIIILFHKENFCIIFRWCFFTGVCLRENLLKSLRILPDLSNIVNKMVPTYSLISGSITDPPVFYKRWDVSYPAELLLFIHHDYVLSFSFRINSLWVCPCNAIRSMDIFTALCCNYCMFLLHYGGFPRGVMVKAMDCRIVVSEFVLQSRYCVHFRANTLGKGMNPHILPAVG